MSEPQGEGRGERIVRGVRTARLGLLANAALVVVKVVAGVAGNSYALIADGVESSLDVFGSLVVWRGLKVSGRGADDTFHFGYGKAESVAAAGVALLILGAAAGIAIQAVREIQTPHQLPAPWTLAVLGVVVLVKEVLFRRVIRVGHEVESRAVKTDAWHHRSDAITSAAVFIGVAAAVVGGPGWESADDWAALLAAAIIAVNGFLMLRPAVADLMDRAPDPAVLERVVESAERVPGVRATEKLRGRNIGFGYYVELHVQADPAMPLVDAHHLGHRVKAAILADVGEVADAVIHMEPYEPHAARRRG